jgi:hypothetical protein
MNTYYIELPNTGEDCKTAIKSIYAHGYLTHFEWGCKEGHHIGFFSMETEDSQDPLRILPAFMRKNAKVYKVHKLLRKKLTACINTV